MATLADDCAPVRDASAVPRAGELVAWPELVTLVRGCMRRIVGPTNELDDLTQMALMRLARHVTPDGRFEGDAQISTFAYRVCVGVARNHWRWWKRWSRRFHLGDEGAMEPFEDPRVSAAERARAARLHAVLEKMSPDRRIVLTLCDLEELPASRVAEILECPEPTVRSRLRHARIDLAARALKDPWFRGEYDRGGS